MSVFGQLRDKLGLTVDATPNNELIVAPKIRLVGTIFDGSTLDTNFYTKADATATVTQVDSQLLITSGTASPHAASVYTVRKARWVTGTSNKYRCQLRFGASGGTANVTWRWGVGAGATMPTVTDGAFFALTGTVFSINTQYGAAGLSTVNSGSFNGVLGASYTPGANITTYEILYTLAKIYFFVGGSLLHTVSTTTAHWTKLVTFHAFADVTNTGASAVVIAYMRMMNITRLGQIETISTSKLISGVAATYVMKYGAGRLHKMVFGNTSGTSISIYDAVSVTGTPFVITTATATLGNWDFDWEFFNGLTMVTSGDNLQCLVIYE